MASGSLALGSRVRTKTKIEAERVGKYMIRPLLALDRLSFLEPAGKVVYRHGDKGDDLETMDYLEFIARRRNPRQRRRPSRNVSGPPIPQPNIFPDCSRAPREKSARFPADPSPTTASVCTHGFRECGGR